MTLSLLLACLWAITATCIAMLPTKDHHWRAAYGLIAVGIPLLGFVTWQNGPTVGLLVFAAGASILRWPMLYLGRWLRRLVTGHRTGPMDPPKPVEAPDPAEHKG